MENKTKEELIKEIEFLHTAIKKAVDNITHSSGGFYGTYDGVKTPYMQELQKIVKSANERQFNGETWFEDDTEYVVHNGLATRIIDIK